MTLTKEQIKGAEKLISMASSNKLPVFAVLGSASLKGVRRFKKRYKKMK